MRLLLQYRWQLRSEGTLVWSEKLVYLLQSIIVVRLIASLRGSLMLWVSQWCGSPLWSIVDLGAVVVDEFAHGKQSLKEYLGVKHSIEDKGDDSPIIIPAKGFTLQSLIFLLALLELLPLSLELLPLLPAGPLEGFILHQSYRLLIPEITTVWTVVHTLYHIVPYILFILLRKNEDRVHCEDSMLPVLLCFWEKGIFENLRELGLLEGVSAAKANLLGDTYQHLLRSYMLLGQESLIGKTILEMKYCESQLGV